VSNCLDNKDFWGWPRRCITGCCNDDQQS